MFGSMQNRNAENVESDAQTTTDRSIPSEIVSREQAAVSPKLVHHPHHRGAAVKLVYGVRRGGKTGQCLAKSATRADLLTDAEHVAGGRVDERAHARLVHHKPTVLLESFGESMRCRVA